MTDKVENIYTALHAVMKEVGYVQKQSSPNLSYTYAGEAALIAAIRPSMVEYGIFVYPASIPDFRTEVYTTKSGSLMNLTRVEVIYRFLHVASQSYIDVYARGEGSDSGDKSGNKAMTGAYKYALRQALMIETGDDPDKDASVERASTGGKKKASTYDHTLAGIIQLGEDLGLDEDAVKAALKGAGYTKWDPEKWDEMKKALATAAVTAKAGNGSNRST